MGQEIEIEKLFLEKFCLKEKRVRLNKLIDSKKGRLKLSNEIHSLNFIDYSKFELNIENELENVLRKTSKFYDCYLISEINGLDAQRLEKNEALNKVIYSNYTTIIIFGNAEIIYCEGEGIKNRWLSK